MRRVLVFAFLFSIVDAVLGQCNEFYQFKEGSEWEMESYNPKGKRVGRTHQLVSHFSSVGDGFEAQVHTISYDKKDEEVMNGDLEFKCANGVVLVDMRNFVNEEQMKAFQNYEMKVESDNLEVPSQLSVGQTLKDGTITLTAIDAPMAMSISVAITDRKVAGKETITTPAGTFDCYKITSNSTVKTKMAIGMTFNFSTIEWMAPLVAVVKSESYRNGKLQGYSLLTMRK